MKKTLLKSLFILVATVLVFAGCKKEGKTDSGIGSGSFTFAGTTYSGLCVAVSSTYCPGATDVVITSGSENIAVYNIPTASSGTFNITNGWKNTGTCELNILSTIGNGGYAGFAGTLTKTGAKSFTFSITMTPNPSSTVTSEFTGSGSYK